MLRAGHGTDARAAVGGQVRVASLSVLSLFLYGFLEWLFFATKPSFLSALNWWDRWQVLCAALAPLALGALAFHLLLAVPACVFPWPVWRRIGALLPAVVAAATGLMLVDNFTYTLFQAGVKTTGEGGRFLYMALIAALWLFCFRWVLRAPQGRIGPGSLLAAGLLIGLFLQAPLFRWQGDLRLISGGNDRQADSHALPNIVFLSSDGLNASQMSVYGYEKPTSPFLEVLAVTSLLAENAFTNAGPTAASVTSRLTGKWPTQTRVIYPPDILRGEDSYQHLPGLLRRLGYGGLDVSIRNYADTVDLNFREAFDVANFRPVKRQAGLGSDWLGLDSSYFLYQLQDRLRSRLKKIFLDVPMDEAFEEATEGDRSYRRDPARMKALFDFIDSNGEPFFCHVHLMGTHGPRFRTHRRVFSEGLEQDDLWMKAFYEDAILDFDDSVRDLVEFLKERHQFDRTVLIIGSDHGQRFRTADRIPLLIRFPGGEHAGRISANVQNLDIAPTLLDYLEQPIPEWMVGRSLLGSSLDPNYPILAANRGATRTTVTSRGRQLDTSEIHPPFYSLGQISVVLCSNAYRLYFENGILSHYAIPGHTSPCPDPPEAARIESLLIEHLQSQNYDTTSLQRPLRFMETARGF